MIKADDVKPLDEADEERVAVIEEHISDRLKANKGIYQQPLYGRTSGEPSTFLGAKGDISDAVWAEVARRCLAAGWALKIEHTSGNVGPSRLMKIVHPLAVLPGDYFHRAGAEAQGPSDE